MLYSARHNYAFVLIFNVSLVKYLLYRLLDEPEQQVTMLTNPSIRFLHLLVSTLGLQDSDKSIERKKENLDTLV